MNSLPRRLLGAYLMAMLNVVTLSILGELIDHAALRPLGFHPRSPAKMITQGFGTDDAWCFLLRFTLFFALRSVLYYPVFGSPAKENKLD